MITYEYYHFFVFVSSFSASKKLTDRLFRTIITQKGGVSVDLKIAKKLLQEGSYTCVLCKDGNTATSTFRGVKPLLNWLETPALDQGFCAADKVVGRATAFLYCLLGAKAVYAGIMSEAALAVLEEAGIAATYGQLVPYIVNRTGDGMCPMEAATLDVKTPEEALAAVKKALAELDKKV